MIQSSLFGLLLLMQSTKATKEENLAKYDTNKDGKLDETEKAARKADEDAEEAAKKAEKGARKAAKEEKK